MWRLTSFSFALLLSAPIVLAWNEPTGFRDIPWGSQPDVVRQRFPDFTCERDFTVTPIKSHCSGHLIIGAVRVFTVIHFETGGMDTVSLLFTSEQFTQMKVTFIERYGQPTKTYTVPIQNAMGAQFINEILEWNGMKVLIRLEKYSTKI